MSKLKFRIICIHAVQSSKFHIIYRLVVEHLGLRTARSLSLESFGTKPLLYVTTDQWETLSMRLCMKKEQHVEIVRRDLHLAKIHFAMQANT